MISELVNTVNCAGLQYNCDSLNNLCLAIKQLVNDGIFGCLRGSFVDLGSVCGTPQQISVIYDTANNCYRFAVYNAAAGTSHTFGFETVGCPRLPQNAAGYVLPQDFPTPNWYYTMSDYFADGGTAGGSGPFGTSMRPAPGLDLGKVQNSLYARVAWNNNCDRTYSMYLSFGPTHLATAQIAYDANAWPIWRARVNGGTWHYPIVPGTGGLSLSAGVNNLDVWHQYDYLWWFPAGDIEVEWFYVGNNTPATTGHWNVNTYQPTYATPYPLVQLRPYAGQ
jgi:hypothetical protein